MDDTKKMLQAIVNGQSVLKGELLQKIEGVDKKVEILNSKIDGVEKRLIQRIDKIGLQAARLEDDASTRDEHDELKHRTTKLEDNFASQ